MVLWVEQSVLFVVCVCVLGYVIWQGDVGLNEMLILVICVFDGSFIYFIDVGEVIYECDFYLCDGVMVCEDYFGIDYLVLGMEVDSCDNWVMFFCMVFGFFFEYEQMLLDLYGLVCSLVVCSLQGDICLVLNILQSWVMQIVCFVVCYQGVGLQYVVFVCCDLLVVCDQFVEVVCYMLLILVNYYDDLLVCFGGELDVGQFQCQQFFYDCDLQGGDFLYFYIWFFIVGCFFFELIECWVGYVFYGVVNVVVCLVVMQYCQFELNGLLCVKYNNNIFCI